LTDENSGIAKDSRIRAPLIAGELIVYGLQPTLDTPPAGGTDTFLRTKIHE
jgi:hypothetical protein